MRYESNAPGLALLSLTILTVSAALLSAFPLLEPHPSNQERLAPGAEQKLWLPVILKAPPCDPAFTQTGGPGDDILSLLGTTGVDHICQYGQAGNDTSYAEGNDGGDTIFQDGGTGDDHLDTYGGWGNDMIWQYGGEGKDRLFTDGGSGNDQILQQGGSDDDNLEAWGSSENDQVTQQGGAGNDVITALIGSGDDTLTIDAGDGDDSITCTVGTGTDNATIDGGPGIDTLTVSGNNQSYVVKNAQGTILKQCGTGGTTITVTNVETIIYQDTPGGCLAAAPVMGKLKVPGRLNPLSLSKTGSVPAAH